MKKVTATTKQRFFYTEGLCFQPMAQTYDFSKSDGEQDVIKAYKGQLGKSKHYKFTTYLRLS